MHSLNWDDLRYFIEVVRSSNVSQAGERMGVNQSTVSRRIAELESRLGKPLFDRTSTGWIITPTGETIVELAEKMASSVHDIQRKVDNDTNEVRGLLRVTTLDICVKRFILPAIQSFKQVHPDADIELITNDGTLDLAAREADIAFRGVREPPENLVGRRIANLTFHVYGHAHLFQSQTSKPSCITWIGDGSTLPTWINKNFPEVKRPYRTNSVVAMVEMCKAGLGLAQLPCAIGDEAEELVRMPVDFVESGPDLWVLSHVDLRTTARVRIFRDFLVEHLTKDVDLFEGRKPRNTQKNLKKNMA